MTEGPLLLPLLTGLAVAAALLVIGLATLPEAMLGRFGKILAFVAFFLLPVLLTGTGTQLQLQHAKTTEFCLSCHVMEPYGRSLALNDADAIPASHFQNRRVDREHACFDCHTTYTMYGDFEAKLRGLKHVWVQYLGGIPDEIELYEPYNNRECLHCHADARSFEENELHADDREALRTGDTSCLECHDLAHAVDESDDGDFWIASDR